MVAKVVRAEVVAKLTDSALEARVIILTIRLGARIHSEVFRLMHSEALLPRVLIHLAGPLLTRSQANRITRLE